MPIQIQMLGREERLGREDIMFEMKDTIEDMGYLTLLAPGPAAATR